MKVTAEEYDLIGYRIVSPFHLMALTAFAQNFQPEKKSLNLLVIVSKGPWKQKILTSDSVPDPRLKVTFLEEEEAGLKFPVWWPLFLMLRPFISWIAKLTIGARVPVCAPTLSCLRFSSRSLSALWNLEPILIDEGIGSFNTIQNFKREAQRQFRKKWVQALAFWAFRLVNGSLRVLGGNRITLFSFARQRPVLNRRVADSYRRVFKMGYDRRDKPLRFGRSVVLILTQPFSESGVCAPDELVDEIEKLLPMIRQKGEVPVLKVHPAEDPTKYFRLGLDHVEYEGPAEEIFAAAGCEIAEIWGFSSTSLIIGSALYGIRARRMELPWAEATVEIFKDESRALFLAYTETVGESGASKF